ncbi:hypothetical protein AAC03nite_23760 [Alicyclobacillus acidoterrestris]|nr:hypothetical protein AAC03nite_23760 [Alicyclobacillus acidoterrestris]
MHCPHCGHHDLGKIGSHRYYCSNCFNECVIRDDTVQVFGVDIEGDLVVLESKVLTEQFASHNGERS